MYCQNCGAYISTNNVFCPRCGVQIQKYNSQPNEPMNSTVSSDSDESDVPTSGYLQDIIDSSFMSRLLTGLPLSILIGLIPMSLILGLVFILVKLNINNAFTLSIAHLIINMPMMWTASILTWVLGLIALWFQVSHKGLSMIDKWITPRYYRHLKKHKPNYTNEGIDSLATSHLITFSNILLFFGYLVYLSIVIYIVCILFMIWMCVSIVLAFLGGGFRSWHFFPKGILFPTHWY